MKFSNKGGLVMPLIIEFTFADGTKTTEFIPAEIWRYNENEITKTFAFEKQVTNIVVDPENNTADTDTENNVFPRVDLASRFDKFSKNAAATIDPTGVWDYSAKTPQGDQKGTITLTKKKKKWEGTLTGSNGTYEMQDISIDGNELTFYFVIAQGEGIKVDGSIIILEDEFLGKLEIAGAGTFDLSGKRK